MNCIDFIITGPNRLSLLSKKNRPSELLLIKRWKTPAIQKGWKKENQYTSFANSNVAKCKSILKGVLCRIFLKNKVWTDSELIPLNLHWWPSQSVWRIYPAPCLYHFWFLWFAALLSLTPLPLFIHRLPLSTTTALFCDPLVQWICEICVSTPLIWIRSKIEWVLSWFMFHPSTKFQKNLGQ